MTIGLVDDVEDGEAITNEENLVGYSSDDDENDVEDEVVFIEAVVQKPKSSVGDGRGACTVQNTNIEPQRNKDKVKSSDVQTIGEQSENITNYTAVLKELFYIFLQDQYPSI